MRLRTKVTKAAGSRSGGIGMAYKLIESAHAKIGVLVAPNGGMIAVALAAPPDSGKFDDGTADLTTIAGWLNADLEALPAGQCSL